LVKTHDNNPQNKKRIQNVIKNTRTAYRAIIKPTIPGNTGNGAQLMRLNEPSGYLSIQTGHEAQVLEMRP